MSEGTLAPPPRAASPARRGNARELGEPPAELPLVGREHELAALVDAHAGAQPDGGLAVIEGEAGIGKTRLAHELARRARDEGAVVLAARCHDDEAGLPYGPIVELLREAASHIEPGGWPAALPPQRLADASLLLPELASLGPAVPDALPLDGPGAQVRLLEGVAAVISAACEGPAPGVVLLDDVHAADEATLDAISYLGRRLSGRALLLVVSWRSEAVPPGHRLRRLAADLARDGRAAIVSPARLGEDEVGKLVHAVQPDAAAPGLERRVYLESEGLPLFVAEYLAALRAGGERAQEPLPREVRGLLEARLGGLGDVARQVLGAAAAIGRSFDLDTVRQASGRSDEETVGALEELVAHGVVRRGPGTRARLRLLAPEAARARLRADRPRAAAPAARARRGRAVGARPGGESAAARRAAPAPGRRRRAARGALPPRRRARRVAARARRRARAPRGGARAGPSRRRRPARAHRRPAHAARRLRRRARELRERRGRSARPAALATIEHKLGGVHQRRGEWELAEASPRAGARRGRRGAQGLRARIAGRPRPHAAPRRPIPSARRRSRARRSRSPSAAADRRAQAQAHNMLGVLATSAGEPRPALGGARAQPRAGRGAGRRPRPRRPRSTTSRSSSATPASSSARSS